MCKREDRDVFFGCATVFHLSIKDRFLYLFCLLTMDQKERTEVYGHRYYIYIYFLIK